MWYGVAGLLSKQRRQNVNDTTQDGRTPMPTTVPSAIMSGPELYAIMMSGYEPIGIVVGVSATAMGSGGFGRSIRALFKRGEMTAVSSTSYEARRRALQQAEDDAKKLGANLVLVHGWEVRDMGAIVEIACNATALKKVGDLKTMPMATATS